MADNCEQSVMMLVGHPAFPPLSSGHPAVAGAVGLKYLLAYEDRASGALPSVALDPIALVDGASFSSKTGNGGDVRLHQRLSPA